MAQTFVIQLPETPFPNERAFVNFSGTDIPAYTVVKLDATNALGPSNQVDGIGVILPAADGDTAIGITLEILKAAASGVAGPGGRVVCFGPIVPMTAAAAITAGAWVMSDFSVTPGAVITATTGKSSVGICLTTAAGAADPVLVMVTGGYNG